MTGRSVGRSVGRRFFTFWPRRRIVGSEPEGSPRARVRSEMAMFEYPVKIQATAAIPERRRGRETRDASARLECYRCADTTNQ